MTKVWVVMGNDFPDSTFSSEELADEFVKTRIAQEDKNSSNKTGARNRIYWRHYEFDVDAKVIVRSQK